MHNHWRIPTLMELALIVAFRRTESHVHLWSITKYDKHRLWATNWQNDHSSPNYSACIYADNLECIFVNTSNSLLRCSKRYPLASFYDTLEICKELNRFEYVEYVVQRPKICHGK